MKGLKSVIVQGLFEKLAKEGHLAPVVCRSGNAIHWINIYLVDKAILFAITYLLDRDLPLGPPLHFLIKFLRLFKLCKLGTT